MPLRAWRHPLDVGLALVVVAAVAAAYVPALDATFVWDDHVLAERDATFRHAPLTDLLGGPFWPTTPLADAIAPYYRPLVLASLRMDLALGGTARIFHRTNVGLHLGACVLLSLTATRLGVRGGAAAVCALLWGLAPRLTESVVWISGRTDLLATFFGLAALATSPDLAPGHGRRAGAQLVRSALSGVLLFAALLSKEVGLAFAAATAVAVANGRHGARRSWWARLAANVVLPTAAFFALRGRALADHVEAPRPLGAGKRLATALEAVGRYTEMTVDPLRPQTVIGLLGEVDWIRAAVGGLALLAVGAAWWRHRRRLHLGVKVGAALGGGALALVLHVVPLTLAGAVTADRLLYVPLAGAVLGAGVVSTRLSRPTLLASGAVATLVAGAFFIATRERAVDYQDEATFWVVASERAHPRNTTAVSALAGVARDAAEYDVACRLYEKVNRILVDSGRAETTAHRRASENLVACWVALGRYEDARALAELLARAHPTSGRVQMSLGFSRLHALDFDGAAEAFTSSLRLDPRLASIVRPAMDDLALSRSEDRVFKDLSKRERERPRYARHLGRLGHRPEAEVVHLRIVEDPSAPLAERSASLSFLLTFGSVDAARRALEASAFASTTSERELLSARTEQSDRVRLLAPRIAAIIDGKI